MTDPFDQRGSLDADALCRRLDNLERSRVFEASGASSFTGPHGMAVVIDTMTDGEISYYSSSAPPDYQPTWTVDQDDWLPVGTGLTKVVYPTLDGLSLTGIDLSTLLPDGGELTIVNGGDYPFTITNEDAASADANQFYIANAEDLRVLSGGIVTFRKDPLTGQITASSGSPGGAFTIPAGVAAGTYALATVTVDAYGRVTAIAAGPTPGTANQVLGINAAGNAYEYKTFVGTGVTVSHAAGQILLTVASGGWVKYTFSHTQFQDASTFKVAAATVSIGAGDVLEAVSAEIKTAFVGTGPFATYTLRIRRSGTANTAAFDAATLGTIAQTFASNTKPVANGMGRDETANPPQATSLTIEATSSGANLNTSTAGSVDVWVKITTLP